MIQAYKSCKKLNPTIEEEFKIPDTIAEQTYYETEYNQNGDKIIKQKIRRTNITKKINETAKLLKEKTAEEKIAEIEKIFTNKEKKQ